MRFAAGQQVVCIADDSRGWDYTIPRFRGWWIFRRHIKPKGPKHGEIVTVICYPIPSAVRLKEYQRNAEGELIQYGEHNFAPLMDISELQSILETQPQEI